MPWQDLPLHYRLRRHSAEFRHNGKSSMREDRWPVLCRICYSRTFSDSIRCRYLPWLRCNPLLCPHPSCSVRRWHVFLLCRHVPTSCLDRRWFVPDAGHGLYTDWRHRRYCRSHRSVCRCSFRKRPPDSVSGWYVRFRRKNR